MNCAHHTYQVRCGWHCWPLWRAAHCELTDLLACAAGFPLLSLRRSANRLPWRRFQCNLFFAPSWCDCEEQDVSRTERRGHGEDIQHLRGQGEGVVDKEQQTIYVWRLRGSGVWRAACDDDEGGK